MRGSSLMTLFEPLSIITVNGIRILSSWDGRRQRNRRNANPNSSLSISILQNTKSLHRCPDDISILSCLQDTDAFCRQVLSSAPVVTFLNQNFVCWGGSIHRTPAFLVCDNTREPVRDMLCLVRTVGEQHRSNHLPFHVFAGAHRSTGYRDFIGTRQSGRAAVNKRPAAVFG